MTGPEKICADLSVGSRKKTPRVIVGDRFLDSVRRAFHATAAAPSPDPCEIALLDTWLNDAMPEGASRDTYEEFQRNTRPFRETPFVRFAETGC